MSITDAIAEFLASLRSERGLAASTIDAYRRDLGQYVAFLHGRAATPELIGDFVTELHERRLSGSSIARKIAAIRGLHRFLVTEAMADEDPTVLLESPKRPRPLPKALTVTEIERLLGAPDPTVPLGRRDRALLEFLYATGARVTETVSLDQIDIDLTERRALLTGKGGRQRIVPVGTYAVAAVEAYLPERMALRRPGRDPGALFLNTRGGRLTRQGVFMIVRRQADRAGLAPVSPHVLRHSAATHMVEGGADLRTVQEMLGHASISTTQVYTRVSPEHLLKVYAGSHPRS